MTPVFVAISQAQAPFMAVLLWSSGAFQIVILHKFLFNAFFYFLQLRVS